jgi:hypothetical protein
MPVAPSPQDLLDQFIAEAVARNPRLRFAEGDITLAQGHGAQAMADAVLRYGAQAFRETFIDGAKGDALTALVDDHLNLQRSPATAAQVTVAFTRTSAGAAGTIPAGTVVATTFDADGNEVRFTTDTLINVGAGNNGPFAIGATATAVGRAGNVAGGELSRIVDQLFDSTFTVTNADLAAGGNAEESDDELKLRARSFWTTLRRGTLGALEFGALTVATVRVAKATEDATGLVTVVVTDTDGNSNAQMVALVEAALEDWRAAGVTVTVLGGAALLTDVAATMTLRDGVDATILGPLVIDAIEGRMFKLRQGETLYLDMLTAAVLAVDPDGILAVDFGALVDDVVPTSSQVIRPGTVTAS